MGTSRIQAIYNPESCTLTLSMKEQGSTSFESIQNSLAHEFKEKKEKYESEQQSLVIESIKDILITLNFLLSEKEIFTLSDKNKAALENVRADLFCQVIADSKQRKDKKFQAILLDILELKYKQLQTAYPRKSLTNDLAELLPPNNNSSHFNTKLHTTGEADPILHHPFFSTLNALLDSQAQAPKKTSFFCVSTKPSLNLNQYCCYLPDNLETLQQEKEKKSPPPERRNKH